ncbi:hypothetical protein FNO01nite_30420 [Flavobacterium noncentrifugens]|uniref:Uncharacterized protein n=2 Tax=Flavobacterium noncentrifugens TaxID=1128970 RepID=A0A1G9BUB6_9FLAO|nr:hypothetical protein FNO01nite_30420 [Flavobacterium noncentrifugens]SDK43016.1 hypothetical protein SAMN04487935_3355 [Flavobacterium noncentrifugens]
MEFAKSLYLSGGITQKEIAERISVTEKTLTKWIKEGKWDTLKKSLLTTKQNQLTFLYDQLECLNLTISQRPDPIKPDEKIEPFDLLVQRGKFATSKEADVIIKLTNAIKKLETETSVGDTVEVARNFIEFVRPQNLELAKQITNLFDVFITAKMK